MLALHPTTVRALHYYRQKRQTLFPWGETLFVRATSRPLSARRMARAFRRLTRGLVSRSEKRPVRLVDLDDLDLASPGPDERLLAVHEVLDELAKTHPTQAEVVKLRYFVGMTNEETGEALGISVATVCNYWTFARTWIFNELKNSKAIPASQAAAETAAETAGHPPGRRWWELSLE